MKEYRVLLDLSTIMSGQSYAGIPQDTRLLFKTFSEAQGIKPIGLICSMGWAEAARLKFKKNDNSIHQALSYTDYFLKLEKPPAEEQSPTRLQKVTKKLLQAHQLFQCGLKVFKKNYYLHAHDKKYDDYIWRKAFNELVDSRFKDLILQQEFVLSDFNKFILTQRILHNFSMPTVHTPNIDFAIFQYGLPQCPNISKGTIPIVRFHDAVPLRYPDTVADRQFPKIHAKSLISSAKQAYFVCNSQPVRDELLTLMPSLEKRAFVVPPSLFLEDTVAEKNEKALASIINARRSSTFKVKVDVGHDIMRDNFEYVISVSTLEPRKNYLSLIRAWERTRYLHKGNLRLVIVGSVGWKSEPLIDAMRHHVMRGDIIHLEKVPVFELATLYAHARAFIFPTYYEGFGSTTIEAMHGGCPVLVSDTPTTRWVLGDAALYCDPYDVVSIANGMERLLYSAESQHLSQDLKRRGYELIKKYSSETVGKQWQELFEKLKSNPQ